MNLICEGIQYSASNICSCRCQTLCSLICSYGERPVLDDPVLICRWKIMLAILKLYCAPLMQLYSFFHFVLILLSILQITNIQNYTFMLSFFLLKCNFHDMILYAISVVLQQYTAKCSNTSRQHCKMCWTHFYVVMIDRSSAVWINWLNCCEIGSDSYWRDTIDICIHHWRVDLHPSDKNSLTSKDTPASVKERESAVNDRWELSEIVKQQLLTLYTLLLFCLSCLDEKWQKASQSMFQHHNCLFNTLPWHWSIQCQVFLCIFSCFF